MADSGFTYIAARPTVYKGIRMRSRLEAEIAEVLDQCEVRWTYEGDAFADGTTQYLPDFVTDRHGCDWFVEVKPLKSLRTAAFDKMGAIWSSNNEAMLEVATKDSSWHPVVSIDWTEELCLRIDLTAYITLSCGHRRKAVLKQEAIFPSTQCVLECVTCGETKEPTAMWGDPISREPDSVEDAMEHPYRWWSRYLREVVYGTRLGSIASGIILGEDWT